MLRFIHLKGVMATLDVNFSPSSTKRTPLTNLPSMEKNTRKEINKHREGANKRPDMITHFITICGKPFNIFVKYHWNWQLLWA